MNIRNIIIAIAVIVVLPVVYVIINGIETEEKRTFHGLELRSLAEGEGSVTGLTAAENQANAPMRVTFAPAYIEKVTGWATPNPKGLDLQLTTVTSKGTACMGDGRSEPGAIFATAAKCAEADFKQMKLPKPTNVLVSAPDEMIVYGNAGENQVKVWANTIIATYVSPDMTQSERKREACIAKMMVSHVLGNKDVTAAICAPKDGG